MKIPKELIERVEKATGPDEQLAIHINEALEIASYITDDGDPAASIDAALALTERMLPGWSLQLYRHPDGAYATLYRLGEVAFITDGSIERRVTTPYYEGIRVDDAQAPLAILAATLRALQEQK